MNKNDFNLYLEDKLRSRFPSINLVDSSKMLVRGGKFYCAKHKWRRALATDEEFLKAGWLSFFLMRHEYNISQFSLCLRSNTLTYRYETGRKLNIHFISMSYEPKSLFNTLQKLTAIPESGIIGLCSDTFFLFFKNIKGRRDIILPPNIENIYQEYPFLFHKKDITLIMYHLCSAIYEQNLSALDSVELACILYQACLVYPIYFKPQIIPRETIYGYLQRMQSQIDLKDSYKIVLSRIYLILACFIPSIYTMQHNNEPRLKKRALAGVAKFLTAKIGDTSYASEALIAGYQQLALSNLNDKEYYLRMRPIQLLSHLPIPEDMPLMMLSSFKRD